MSALFDLYPEPRSAFSAAARQIIGAWRVVHFGALALVVVFSSVTHDQVCRRNTAREVYWTSWQVLPGFALLSTLLSLVLIRIVIVTALSYGLSQYALEMVIRVLVLELIPLFSALFVTLRCDTRITQEINAALRPGATADGAELWRRVLVPRLIAAAFSVSLLAAVSGFVALLIAYTSLYGFSPWGLESFTHALGQIFEPVVMLGLLFKVMLFSLAVGISPIASSLAAYRAVEGAQLTILTGVARLFLALVLIEAASLAIRYA